MFPATMISEKALTGAIFACFICLPFSVAVYFGAVMAVGSGRTDVFLRLFGIASMLLPPSLVLGPVGAVIFKMLGWRRAAWGSVWAPVVLIVFMAAMTALGESGLEEIP